MNTKKPSFGLSLIVLAALVAMMVVGFGIMRITLQSLLFLVIVVICAISYIGGFKWKEIQDAMFAGLTRGLVAMSIMFLIGMIIGSWITAGTVPALIYYGLKILNPSIFLPAAFLICCVTSVATGTSWGSAGTVGLALMGIGTSMGMPAHIIAGAVVSGAFFGDKLSPLSDTTILASATAECDIYKHMGAMILTQGPAAVIATIMYAVIGMKYAGGAFDPASITLITDGLADVFNINPIVLIPVVVLLGLSIAKVPSLPSMAAGILSAVVVAMIMQDVSFTQIMTNLFSGFKIESGIYEIDKLLNRGGMSGMMGSIYTMIIALLMGGLLSDLGYMQTIVENLLGKIKNVGTLITATICTGIFFQATTCNTMVSIILAGNAYKSAFDAKGLARPMLSRCLEEGSTLSAGLIPWNTAGVYMATTLGVATFSYLPFCFFNLINIGLSIVLSYLGIFVVKAKIEEAAK